MRLATEPGEGHESSIDIRQMRLKRDGRDETNHAKWGLFAVTSPQIDVISPILAAKTHPWMNSTAS